MKKIVVFILCVATLLSCMMFTSCGDTRVDNIDGLTAEEAYERALHTLDDVDRYHMDTGAYAHLNILGIRIPVMSADNFHYDIYNGENFHSGFYDLSEELAKIDMTMEELMEGAPDELWCVDGVCYERFGSKKYCYDADDIWIENSEFEKDVERILRDNDEDTVTCYKSGDEYYFVTTFTDSDGVENKYTVYIDEDGYLTRVRLEMDMFFLMLTMDTVYTYEDVPTVTPPDDVENYVKR